jgi:hypothetical protein
MRFGCCALAAALAASRTAAAVRIRFTLLSIVLEQPNNSIDSDKDLISGTIARLRIAASKGA